MSPSATTGGHAICRPYDAMHKRACVANATLAPAGRRRGRRFARNAQLAGIVETSYAMRGCRFASGTHLSRCDIQEDGMDTMTFRRTRVVVAVAGALLSLAAGHASGSAFAL